MGRSPRGRSSRLARYVPPKVPVLGPLVWKNYDLLCRKLFAAEFLAEWEAAG
jgi:hypothetical protein